MLRVIFIIYLCLFNINAKAEIITSYSLNEIISKIDNLSSEAIIFIDVDDTIITPKSSSFRVGEKELNLIDEIKRDKKLYSNYEEIISNWRLKREVILVDSNWPEAISNLKKQYKVFALTKMDSGRFGNIKSMEEWRYGELKDLGIEFSKIEEVADKAAPSHYKGIFMTGPYLKSKTIDKYLPILKPSSIVFIDDKYEYLKDVSDFCEQRKIPFMGILYRGVDKIPGHLDPEIKKIQLQYLINEAKWLEDKEAKKLAACFK